MKIDFEKLEEAIAGNPDCSGNILLDSTRVFNQVRKGNMECLVSLNNKMYTPHYLGHVFYHNGIFVVSIIALDRWLNPSSKKNLFDKFWYFISEIGCWYPIGGDVFAVANDFQAGIEKLYHMLKVFSLNKAIGDCDYRPVEVYPFPDPFRERVSFNKWKKNV